MEELRQELRFAAIGTLVLDLLIFGISVLCIGLTLSVPLGLLLGSAGMYANLLLLRRTVQNAVYHGRKNTIGGYLLRLLIASAVIGAGLKLPQVSALAAILPFLYPKILFGFLAVGIPKKKSDKNGGM
jgi:hypothetical protein